MSPFDSAELAEGLEITILPLSEVKDENTKVRIDSNHFIKSAVSARRLVQDMPSEKLGDIVTSFRKGIFDIKADSYVEANEGVPFVRIGDLTDGLLDENKTAWISQEAHHTESKTALRQGEIVLSKTAYPAASLVTLMECNVSQDIIAVRLSQNGYRRFRPAYIVAFLNSRLGMTLLWSEFQGNVQQHLSLEDAKKLRIPELGLTLQNRVQELFGEAIAGRRAAVDHIRNAEHHLLMALGLADWTPPEPLSYTRSVADVFSAGRLDAEYFTPRTLELIARLSVDRLCVGDVAAPRRERFAKDECETFDYIEIGDVEPDGSAASSMIACAEAPSRATWHVRRGDVITSTVRPIRRLSALIGPNQDGFVCSSGFTVLSAQEVRPEVLLTYLRLPVICELMNLHTSASMYPAIAERDILALPFRTIGDVASTTICDAVTRAREARTRARSILDDTKRAVEIAIEESEDAAMRVLEEAGA